MSLIEAIILAIVQGITEFLPVSSSGHLELSKALLNDQSTGKDSLLFIVVLHVGTVLSTIVVFKNDIAQIIKGLFTKHWNEEKVFSSKIVLSMIPAAIIGVLFEDSIDLLFNENILLVGICLIFTAGLLYLSEKIKPLTKPLSYSSAFIVGLAQAVAILPGISRSGSTIATSLLLGIEKSKAARFSFLMVIPLILGKLAKNVLSGNIMEYDGGIGVLMAGFIVSFLVGFIACKWMISIVKRSKLIYFAIYCFLVGLIAIFTHVSG